jgi:signal transduction histidine kinase
VIVRRSLPLFVAIVASLAISQVWLTWRIAEQDQRLAAQRAKERLDQTADLALDQLAGKLASWELSLREWKDLPPPGEAKLKTPPNTTLIRIAAGSVVVYPAKPLLFVPHPPAVDPPPDAAFDASDKLEFRYRNFVGAIEVLRPLTKPAGRRAEALLRIARLEKKIGHLDEARDAYNRMLGETGIGPGGAPYSLIAMAARCEMAAETCDTARGALLSGRFLLGRDVFEYYWGEINRSQSAGEAPPQEAVRLAALGVYLDDQWRQGSNGRSVEADGSLLIWQGDSSRLIALMAPTGWLDSALKLSSDTSEVRWRMVRAGGGTGVRRPLAEVQLPGVVEFYSAASGTTSGVNRALWFAGVILMLILLVAGSYAMHRGVSRELQVAQVQSDFVSAVSHEFRSPLTSLRGIAELLVNDRIADEAKKKQSYLLLERETRRLQKMVEDLLDFGRMESGRKEYRVEAHDAYSVVRAAVSEFHDEAERAGFAIEVAFDKCAAGILADDEALRRAFRNLLENAVKYSPECRTVWVDGRVDGRRVAISVRDRGIGIEPREQRAIFRKFVRGAAAKRAGIKGTGIGLSMVQQIVEACGGEIRLRSEANVGSTFTVLLPLIEGTRAQA